MTRLRSELDRLYHPSPSPGTAHAGTTRCLVLLCKRPGAWPALRPAWQGVQADLGWPAPAIVVDGVDAIELWFSFQAALSEEQAQGLGQTLIRHYLPDVLPGRAQVRLQAGSADTGAMPPFERLPGQWSAFVAPDLAAVFADDPWLDMPPGEDAQADLLSRLRPVPPEEVAAALQRWATSNATTEAEETVRTARTLVPAQASRELATTGPHAVPATHTGFTLPVGQPASARAFLQQVMNDASVPLQWRVEAAKALLPLEEAAAQAAKLEGRVDAAD
jgi:hypothetical protein